MLYQSSTRGYTMQSVMRSAVIVLGCCTIVRAERAPQMTPDLYSVVEECLVEGKEIAGAPDALKRIDGFNNKYNRSADCGVPEANSMHLCRTLAGPQAAIERRPLWGALAIDSQQGNSWGWAIDYPTVQEAERRALAECGGNCYVVMRFSGQCAAFAADQSRGSTIFGWAKDSSSARAKNAALNACRQRGGKSCVVRVWGCTSR